MKPEYTISLREVTPTTLGDILKLSVAPEQLENVATNAVSIAQAHFHPEAWFRGVYAGETPVGFVMLEDWSLVPGSSPDLPVVLWRFMIDKGQQGKGHGKKALSLIVEHVTKRTALDHFLTSCVEGPNTPKPFYLNFGFVETGAVSDGETVLRYDFDR